jgi:hypothetical protein
MKGVSFSVEFVIAIVLVAVITVLALSLLKPVAGFDIQNFFHLTFPGGEPGQYSSGEGGGTGMPPSGMDQISSQGYDYFTPSEVGCDISNIIYNDMKKFGSNGGTRTSSEEYKGNCQGTELLLACIVGWDEGRIGIINSEDAGKFAGTSCGKCGTGVAMDEACLNRNWATKKVGDSPFCGIWMSDNNEQTGFGNIRCQMSRANGWYDNWAIDSSIINGYYDRNCNVAPTTFEGGFWCYNYAPSDDTEGSDRVRSFASNPNQYQPNPVGMGKEIDTVIEGRSPYVGPERDPSITDYLYYVETTKWYDRPWWSLSIYNVRFIYKVPLTQKGNQLNFFSFSTNLDGLFPIGSIRYNYLGFVNPDARTVYEANLTLTSPVSPMSLKTAILNSVYKSTGKECYCEGTDYDWACLGGHGGPWCPDKTTTINPPTICSSLEDCEQAGWKQFTTDWAFQYGVNTRSDVDLRWDYGNDRWNNLDPRKVDISFEPIDLKIYGTPDLNTNLEPGVYRVIVRNWMVDMPQKQWDPWFGDSKVFKWTIFYDRTIIIEKIS